MYNYSLETFVRSFPYTQDYPVILVKNGEFEYNWTHYLQRSYRYSEYFIDRILFLEDVIVITLRGDVHA